MRSSRSDTSAVRRAGAAGGWIGLALSGFCLVSLAALVMSGSTPGLLLVPVLLPLLAAAALVLLLACAGSTASALALLFVIVFVNDALFRVRDPGDVGLDWQNAMKLALWAAAALVGICRLGTADGQLRRPPMLCALAYVGIALLSTVWSVTANYSFATAFGMAALLLFALAVCELATERQILLVSAAALTLFVLVSWVVYWTDPALGQSPFILPDAGGIVMRMCGIAGQANSLGHVLVVYLGVLFLLWYRGHVRAWLVLAPAALGMVTLIASDSRSSLFSLIVAIMAIVARQRLWLWATGLIAICAGMLALVSVPLHLLVGLGEEFSRSGDPSELFTLTGRTDIWQFAWSRIVEQPWLGFGYNSSKVLLPQFLGIGILIDEAHNMLLQSLLSTGIVGTIPMVLLCVLLLIDYVRKPDPLRDLFFLVTLIGGITEAGAFGATPALLTLFLFLGLFRRHASRATARGGVAYGPITPAAADRLLAHLSG